MNCIFCEILYGAAPATTVYDGIATLGIVPLNPVTKGHVIFIPRKHVRDATEDSRVTGQVMSDVAMHAARLREPRGLVIPNAETVTDFNIITSVGPLATQTVFHMHVHLVPRRASDGLALPWTTP